VPHGVEDRFNAFALGGATTVDKVTMWWSTLRSSHGQSGVCVGEAFIAVVQARQEHHIVRPCQFTNRLLVNDPTVHAAILLITTSVESPSFLLDDLRRPRCRVVGTRAHTPLCEQENGPRSAFERADTVSHRARDRRSARR